MKINGREYQRKSKEEVTITLKIIGIPLCRKKYHIFRWNSSYTL